ncbi:hypothetical protein LSTR_LSTR003750 [Laodelphax striatellus]|uniref:Uncharacterized protein n=1 Tax=Laodelphax striatellus TaxID=195883 RepID=A0A482WQK5_LAOST|nr:hypothetical protein LSTR_LSTR003750 [Laodelphax striatellus]
MLRWLSSVTQPPLHHHHHQPHHPPSPPLAIRHTSLTDDPLATCITLHRNSHVYAVSRVNPLYSEDEFAVVGGQGGTVVIGGGDRREAVGGGGGGGSSGYSSRRSKKSGGSGGSSGGSGEWSLSPIPEGRLPPLSHVQVPRPVWPPRRPRLIDSAHAFGGGGASDSDGGGSSHAHPLAHAHTPEHLLRTLSHTISLAVDQKVMPPEQVLRTLGETINRSLEAISLASAAAAAASGSTPGGGREPLYHDSSSASSSGFSDLTATPPSSSGGSGGGGAIYDKPHSSLSRAGGYEKLIVPPPPLYEAPPAPTSKHQLQNPFMCRGPDFTLDAHQAELLMRKLKQSKRQRCWCRAVTSLMALFFFLFSVMLVSMLLTRGKRFFGSL